MYPQRTRRQPPPQQPKVGLERISRPCPRCLTPYTQMAPACPACLPAEYQSRCPRYQFEKKSYPAKFHLMVVYGLWKGFEECRACHHSEPVKTGKGWGYDDYSVRCNAGLSCLDRQPDGYKIETAQEPSEKGQYVSPDPASVREEINLDDLDLD